MDHASRQILDRPLHIRLLFFLAFLYDAVLGVAFLTSWAPIFDWLKIAHPNHPGYVQFPAALLIIFALIYLQVAWDPKRHRGLIVYGMLLKVAYCGVVFGHFGSGLDAAWTIFAIIDLVFLVLFIMAWWRLFAGYPKPKKPKKTKKPIDGGDKMGIPPTSSSTASAPAGPSSGTGKP